MSATQPTLAAPQRLAVHLYLLKPSQAHGAVVNLSDARLMQSNDDFETGA